MKLALAGSAALLLLVLAWFFARSVPTTSSAAKAQETPTSAPATDVTLAVGDQDVVSRTMAVAELPHTLGSPIEAQPTATVTGRVVLRDDGSAVPDAEVVAFLVLPEDKYERRSCRTDANGVYSFDVKLPADLLSLDALATGRTTSVSEWRNERLYAGREFGVDLHVSRGATLRGRVIDDAANPVANASVRAWCGAIVDFDRPPDRIVTSGSDGSFAVEHIGDAFFAVADAPGLTCSTGLRGELAPGAVANDLDIVLSSPVSMRGRVVDAIDDRPVANALLTIDATESTFSDLETATPGVRRFHAVRREAQSADDGNFDLGDVPLRDWSVTVEHDDYLRLATVRRDHEQPWTIRLESGLTVRGQVFDARGVPALGAYVNVRGGEGSMKRLQTDDQGRFVAPGLKPTRNGLIGVHAPGSGVLVMQPLVFDVESNDEHRVQLTPGRAIAGRVLEESGEPAVDAVVSIEGDRIVDYEARYTFPSTWEWSLRCDRTRTDEAGRFRFDDLYDGVFRVRASPRNELAVVADVTVRSGIEDLTIEIDRQRAERVVLHGRVVDGSTGAPLKEFVVLPMELDGEGGGHGTNRAVSDREGRFRITGLDPGTIQLYVKAPGYATAATPQRELEIGEHEFDFSLHPSRNLTFRIVDRRSDPAPRMTRVSFRALDGSALSFQLGSGTTESLHLFDDVDFVAAGLPAIAIQMVVRPPESAQPEVFDVDLRTQPVGVQTFVLPHVDEDQRRAWQVHLRGTNASDLADVEAGKFRTSNLAEISWPIDRAVLLQFATASGDVIMKASVEPLASGGFATRYTRPGRGWGGSSTSREPWLSVAVPRTVATVEISAEGYVARTLAMDETLFTRQPSFVHLAHSE